MQPPRSPSCFRCHPRRWRHQFCFRRSQGNKSGAQRRSSFRARISTNHINDRDSDPGSILNASTHELQIMPMGSAVASMISSVVSHSANMAATQAVGKVPQPRSTFGKRNIKNQVCICKKKVSWLIKTDVQAFFSKNVILEQRQNKNDSIQSKIIPILKLPRFFPLRIGSEKPR